MASPTVAKASFIWLSFPKDVEFIACSNKFKFLNSYFIIFYNSHILNTLEFNSTESESDSKKINLESISNPFLELYISLQNPVLYDSGIIRL